MRIKLGNDGIAAQGNGNGLVLVDNLKLTIVNVNSANLINDIKIATKGQRAQEQD